MLGNFLVSQGQSGGKVLEVKCSRRKKNGLNFVTAMRRTLKEAFPEQSIGAGGTFVVKKGRVKVSQIVQICLNKSKYALK